MRRREFIRMLAGTAAWPLVAGAQESGKLFRIGYLSPSGIGCGAPVAGGGTARFLVALRELGWIEGKNIALERRCAENRPDRLAELVEQLVHLNVDVIVALGTLAPLAAKRATSTIPIVMTAAGDPLGSGLVSSLARPGENVTGMSLMVPDIGGKRLELIRELLPRIARIAVLWDAANPYPARVFKETEQVARTLGIGVQSLEVRGPRDFDTVFDAAKRQSPEALITVEDPFTFEYLQQIVNFAAAQRLPSMYGDRQYVAAGGLISYGASIPDLFGRAAGYVDKILRGAKPGDLPIQQPTKFELVINLKAAKALGLAVPPSLLARADEVIE